MSRIVWPIVFGPHPCTDVPRCLVDRLYLNMTTAPTQFPSRPDETTTRALLVSIKQASEMLSISRSVIYQLIDAGQLTPIRIGRSVRLPIEQLEQFVANRLAQPNPSRHSAHDDRRAPRRQRPMRPQ